MSDLTFGVVSNWTGIGNAGLGELAASDRTYEFSVPNEMGVAALAPVRKSY